MAKTVDEGFATFLSWLTPTKTESANAKSHRASIEACIKANFGLNRFFRTGSFGNGTSISGYSDVDYFASIPRENLKQNSASTLQALTKVLDDRFPNTGVHIDGPAVVVPFGDERSETTEVVPADFISRSNECSTYDIPNGAGGWMRASPEAHKLYIDNRDDKLANKVKPLIRFLKAWKYYQRVPISSFFLEMYVGMHADKETVIVYPIDIRLVFVKLHSSDLASIQDPMGVSGSIAAYKTATEKAKILSELADAIRRSSNARTNEEAGNMETAIYWWNKVYADLFPSYY